MSERSNEIDFPTAKGQIENEIEAYLEDAGLEAVEVPLFRLEKGETIFRFYPAFLDKILIYDSLDGIKNHVENLRFHTFEDGYIVLQSMGSNLFDTAAITGGTKFKFTSLGSSARVEVSRQGNLTQDEILACLRLFCLFHRKESGGGDPTQKLQKLGVQVYSAEKQEKPWDLIAGYERTKVEVQESLVLPLKFPEVFQGVASQTRQGADHNILPRAILFEGPPGVGKTTMARIIAAATMLPLVYVPVENIVSKYYGESAQNMAAIFDAAAEFERVILFLDEIDSLAGSRQEGLFEATRRVLSVLLRKIDGLESRTGVLTIGATNRAEDLDPALLSRFDQTIHFPLPGLKERSAIFQMYAKHLHADEFQTLVEKAEGLSGRNIKDLCEYAERRWARKLILRKQEVSAPPIAVYLEVIEKKINHSKEINK